MNNEKILKPVEAQLEAYNNRDINKFVICFSEDCICEDAEGNLLMQGRKTMRERYGAMFAASPNLHCKIVHRSVVGNFVFDEERVVGRNGIDGEGHVMAVYTVDADEEIITRVRFYR
ncbi:MAG: nuclear transport factor 2 family protein [Defluviitaleaceae bacterium]|nr:nuclear transport factor 2 family protein [Defluviitaleaceae bacterium]